MNRLANIQGTSWLMIPIIAFFLALGMWMTATTIDFTLLLSDVTTGTTSSSSGLEFYTGNGTNELTLLRGCSDEDVIKFDDGSGVWSCQADSTTSVTGAGAITLDLADDDSNESTSLSEIATTGDTNSIFTEPSTDKLLIDAGNNWPTADTADALSANPSDCAANQFATTIAANGNLTCAAIVDADVPNDITIDNAATADALTANPSDCAADTKADAIAANGNLTCTAVDTGDITDGTIIPTDLNGQGSFVDEECITHEATGPTFETVACGGSGDSIEVEDGDDAGTFTAIDTTARFDDSGDINFNFSDGGAGGPDTITGTVRADSVALGTDTTGGYAASVSEGGPATTATALAANGANCSASQAPLGVDASGAVESCTDFEEELNNSAGLAAALSDETGTGLAVFDTDPVLGGTVQVTGSGSSFTLNLDCSSFANGGTLSVTGSGVVHCQDDNAAAGSSVDVEENNVSAVSGATALDFQDPFDVANDGGEADISIDFTEVGDTTFGSGSDFTWTFDSLGTVTMAFLSSVLSLAQHLLLDNESELRWGENDANGSNYIAVKAPAAVTSNQTCTLEDDATPFDSCVTANPADQNLFETINAPAGTDPVADSTTDTLNLDSPGATVSITGNSSTDTISFDIASVDISDHTNLTAGRSLTLTGDDVAADDELYTVKRSINILNPTTSETNLVQYEYATAATITEVSCSTDTGTVTIQFDERARATPNSAGTNVLTSSLVCDTDSQTTTSFSNAGIAADVPVNLQITATASTPGVVRIHVEATKDD